MKLGSTEHFLFCGGIQIHSGQVLLGFGDSSCIACSLCDRGCVLQCLEERRLGEEGL